MIIDIPTIEDIRDEPPADDLRRHKGGQGLPLAMEDASPQMPMTSRSGSFLDPRKPFIGSIPKDDRHGWRKQRIAPRESTRGYSTRRPMRADTEPRDSGA